MLVTLIIFTPAVPSYMYNVHVDAHCKQRIRTSTQYAVEVMTSQKITHMYFLSVAMVLVHAHCINTNVHQEKQLWTKCLGYKSDF